MTTMTEKILERAAHYERLAAALRLAAHELNGHFTEKKQAGVGAMLSAAVQLRAEQQARVLRSKPKKPARHESYDTLREKVEARKAQVRTLLLASGPLSAGEVRAQLKETVTKSRISQIFHEVGARKVGTGARTRWTLTGPGVKSMRTKKKPHSAAATRARRERSAALIAKLDLTEPRPLTRAEVQSAGGLMRRSYIRKKGDGFIRTAKEFTV